MTYVVIFVFGLVLGWFFGAMCRMAKGAER